jgi:hypothetical protein
MDRHLKQEGDERFLILAANPLPNLDCRWPKPLWADFPNPGR